MSRRALGLAGCFWSGRARLGASSPGLFCHSLASIPLDLVVVDKDTFFHVGWKSNNLGRLDGNMD